MRPCQMYLGPWYDVMSIQACRIIGALGTTAHQDATDATYNQHSDARSNAEEQSIMEITKTRKTRAMCAGEKA